MRLVKVGKISKTVIILIISAILIVSAFAGGFLASQANASTSNKNTVTVQDSADRYVEVPYPIESIVVLWDNPTEVIAALGASDRIVGIDIATKDDVDAGLYPELTDVAVIGSYDEPNYEKIADLNPDVVIMLSSYAPLPDEVASQLEPFGIAVVALDFYRTDVYYREVATLGFMLGLEDKAASYTTFLQDVTDMISERLSTLSDDQRKTVYFEGAAEYGTYGGGGYGCGIPAMIVAGGGIDLYPEITAEYFEVDPEDVAMRNPDVIMKGQSAGYFLTNNTQFQTVYDSIVSRPELSGTTAIRNGDVYVVSFDVTGGARKIFGPMYITKVLYPDLFADFSPDAVLQEYLETYLGRTWQGMYLYTAS
jgi:iron complex transport system substrate-binding protein